MKLGIFICSKPCYDVFVDFSASNLLSFPGGSVLSAICRFSVVKYAIVKEMKL